MPIDQKDARPQSGAQAVRNAWRLVTLVRPFWVDLGCTIALSIAVAALGILPPYLSKLLIDRVYPTGDVTLLGVVVGGMLALQIGVVGASALRSYVNVDVGGR